MALELLKSAVASLQYSLDFFYGYIRMLAQSGTDINLAIIGSKI